MTTRDEWRAMPWKRWGSEIMAGRPDVAFDDYVGTVGRHYYNHPEKAAGDLRAVAHQQERLLGARRYAQSVADSITGSRPRVPRIAASSAASRARILAAMKRATPGVKRRLESAVNRRVGPPRKVSYHFYI